MTESLPCRFMLQLKLPSEIAKGNEGKELRRDERRLKSSSSFNADKTA
jgi:hypothetical protein